MHRRQRRRLVDAAVRTGSVRRLRVAVRVVVVAAAVVVAAVVVVVAGQQGRMQQGRRRRRRHVQLDGALAPLRGRSGLGSGGGGGRCGREIGRIVREEARMMQQGRRAG